MGFAAGRDGSALPCPSFPKRAFRCARAGATPVNIAALQADPALAVSIEQTLRLSGHQ